MTMTAMKRSMMSEPFTIFVMKRTQMRKETLSSVSFTPFHFLYPAFFVLLTIIVYWILEDLRNNLFGKLTLGFLVNVCISYFFIGVHYCLQYYDPSKASYIRSSFCVFLGYIV